jgi:hypothetical protein
LRGELVKKHCQHCLWCLYLAALICWNYEYAVSTSAPLTHSIHNGSDTSQGEVEKQCQAYLDTATNAGSDQQDSVRPLPSTWGMLVIVLQYLESCFAVGMIQEGIEVLQRLTGVRPPPA